MKLFVESYEFIVDRNRVHLRNARDHSVRLESPNTHCHKLDVK